VQVAADALVASGAPHAFMGMTKMGQVAIFETAGNRDCHVILRGGTRGPNYEPKDIEAACNALAKSKVLGRVMVDCSHANSRKDWQRQVDVAHSLAQQVAGGDLRIMGIMVESHLKEGRQDLKPGVPLEPGVSITDGCIGWEQTEDVLRKLAQASRKRQRR
jgi:3-deoxy-7-phosphoheptulonate synthase